MSGAPDLAGQISALATTVNAVLAPGVAAEQVSLAVLAGTLSQFAEIIGTALDRTATLEAAHVKALARVAELERRHVELEAALFAAGLHARPSS